MPRYRNKYLIKTFSNTSRFVFKNALSFLHLWSIRIAILKNLGGPLHFTSRVATPADATRSWTNIVPSVLLRSRRDFILLIYLFRTFFFFRMIEWIWVDVNLKSILIWSLYAPSFHLYCIYKHSVLIKMGRGDLKNSFFFRNYIRSFFIHLNFRFPKKLT